jgi:hypothetical protein
MNKRALLDKDLAKFREELPDYTLGQTLFSMMTILSEGNWTKEDLLTISDQDLYRVCITAMIREKAPANDNF